MRYFHKKHLPLFALLVVALGIIAGIARNPAPKAAELSAAEISAADRARIHNNFGKLPLSFIENQGQMDARVAYTVQTPGHSLYFTQNGHALRLTQKIGKDKDAAAKSHVIKVDLVDAATVRVESLQRAPAIVSYFKGAKAEQKAAIPTHAKIGYVQPWPGIDLAYEGSNGKLMSLYTVAPHADPAQIKLRYRGQDSLALDAGGNLVYTTPAGEIKETAPIAWQDIDGQRLPVETHFKLLDADTVAFQVAAYNPDHALVIDPTLVYAGYIGGGIDDFGTGITVDSSGAAYIIGETYSDQTTFPVSVGPDLTYNDDPRESDVFVAKISAAGNLVYLGYIGGDNYDIAGGIAVDSAGAVYVTGSTRSTQTTFPVTVGPDLTFNAGTQDAFVAKISADGSALVYAGYIGGAGFDNGFGIAVDSNGAAYVTGRTSSDQATFPQTGGNFDSIHNGGNDAFVAKVAVDGSALVYAGYIGGSGSDSGNGIAVDSAGAAYVTGTTDSSQATFPVTGGGDLTHNGAVDVFVAKVKADASALDYAGYIGGSENDGGLGIAVDSGGAAYVTGYAGFSNAATTPFPTLVGPDLSHNGPDTQNDAFVAKVDATGALVYAGFIGGSGDEFGRGIAVDSSGAAYVTGYTHSSELDTIPFPVTVGPDLTHNSVENDPQGGFTVREDAFVAKVRADGSALDYAGYIGGSGAEEAGNGIAVDSSGAVYVVGTTTSDETTFPVVGGLGPDSTFNGVRDAFVVKIADTPGAPTNANATAGNAQATVTFIAPAYIGSSAISGYTVTSTPAGGTDSNANTLGLSHVITGLANGTAYTFTVKATSAAGAGAASNASNSVTPTAPAVAASGGGGCAMHVVNDNHGNRNAPLDPSLPSLLILAGLFLLRPRKS